MTNYKPTVFKEPLGGEIVRVEVREVTYTCPKRGKVTEKIEVKIYDTGGKQGTQVCR